MCFILTCIIFLLILIACLCAWLPGFVTSFIQLQSFVININQELGDKTHHFLQHTLSSYKYNAQVLKREYESGLINLFDPDAIRKRLFSQAKTYKNSFVSFALAGTTFGPDGEIYLGVSRELLPGKTDPLDEGSVMYQFVTKLNSSDLTEVKLESDTGKSTGVVMNVRTNYKVTDRSWWTDSIRGSYDSGLWGIPYYNLVAGMLSTFYGVPICNNSISQANPSYKCETGNPKIGIIKNNINLQLIDNFMESMSLPYDGFAIVIETNGDYVGSSLVGLDSDYQSRLNIENIGYKGISDAIKAVKQTNNPSEPYKYDRRRVFMGFTYIIGAQPFQFDNINWTIIFFYNFWSIVMYLIIYSTITLVILNSLFCVGFVCSNIIAALFYIPIRIINKRFKRIARMDLSFKALWSPITEINSIYSNLEKMKLWLIEYRSFLPQHIQEQYDQDKTSSSGSYHLGNYNKQRSASSRGNAPGTVVPIVHTSPYQSNEDPNDIFDNDGAADISLRDELESSLNDSTIRSNGNGANFGGGKGPRTLSTHDLGSKNQQIIKKFQLGLKRRMVSCLLFEISNFQDVIDKMESSEEVQREVSNFLTFLREIARGSQGFLWSFSSSTHCMFWNVNLFKSDKKNLERCLNTAIRTQLSLTNDNGLKVTMVIGQGLAHFGNVQTGHQMKEFQVIAPFIEDMKKLNFFALDFTVSIVFDSTVMSELKKRRVLDKFVWRPIDCVVIKEGEDPVTLYELIGHSNFKIGNNHLLQNQNDVVKYKEFTETFELVHKNPNSIAKVSEAQERLTALIYQFPSNEMAFYLLKSRIDKILDGTWNDQTLLSYFTLRIRRPVKEEAVNRTDNNNQNLNNSSSFRSRGTIDDEDEN